MSGETTSRQSTSEAGPEGAKAADFTTANNPRAETHDKSLLTAACALGRDEMVPSRAQTHLTNETTQEGVLQTKLVSLVAPPPQTGKTDLSDGQMLSYL